MSQTIKTDICVIGAGSGGLSVAAGAAQLGVSTVLIEKGEMGGDCLNYGCVPSKALLAAAKHAQLLRDSVAFGVQTGAQHVDFARAMSHVQEVIAGIAPMDSEERFTGLGCKVIRAPARFLNPHEVEAGGTIIAARRFVIATGSSAAIPPITGLADTGYLTNETIFSNRNCPDHLIIIGGGPIGMEMAQAHRRLGAKVTVLELYSALAKDDPELTAVVLNRLRAEGVDVLEGVGIDRISQQPGGGEFAISLSEGGQSRTITGSHLLVAAGRKPNIDGLGLELADIKHDARGITVDGRLRTTNRRVFAIGDVIGGLQFTHVAGYHAGIVIRNALFRVPAKADHSTVPWVTYTDPELANVGLTEAQARAQHDHVRVVRWPFAENDRAQAERRTEGLAKIVTGKGGRILGAGIVGPHAGELIQPWILAMATKRKIGAMTGIIAPYPTFGEVNKRAAGAYYTQSLFSPRTKKLVRWLAKLG